MKSLFLITIPLLLIVLLSTDAQGQSKQPSLSNFSNPFLSKVQNNSSTPIFPEISSGNKANEKQTIVTENGSFMLNLKNQEIGREDLHRNLNVWLGLSNSHSFKEVSSKTDELGISHTRYQHYYKGYLVDGSAVITHTKGDSIMAINGRIIEFSDIELNISISENTAKGIAKSYMEVSELIHDYPVETVIIKLPLSDGTEIKLTQKVRIDSYHPFTMCYIYVDAASGKVLNKINLIAHADVPGTGQTLYSGNQAIICDSHSVGYRLRDNGRNIQTFNATNATNLSTSGFAGSTDYNNSSTSWAAVPTLNSFTITAVDQSWWYASFVDETPDLYIKVKDGNNQTVYKSGYYSNTHPTVSWQNLEIILTDTSYTVEVWDYDPVGSDDFGGSYSISTSTGNKNWSGNGNNGTYNVSTTANPALDVHWGMEACYDFYLDSLNRESYDGNGGLIKQYINPPDLQVNRNNAYANGSPYNIMAYGLGDGIDNSPVVGLDVVGHEFTHLVVNNNGNGGLTYQGESGALNESFADIFGTCIEFSSGLSPNWFIGEDFQINEPYWRNMSNPKSTQNPDTYEGLYWINPNSSYDHGGVHFNSGVQNFWFFLLSEGGSGTNDLSNSYTVTGIGMNKARDIAYRNLVTYLTSSATYMDAYYGSLQSAEDLFGNPSAEYTAVREAWYAVGIGNNPNSYCSGTITLTAPTDSFSDGSGSANYHNNTDCRWLIAPPGATQISLDFTAFDTEADYDTVFVYDGPDDTYPVLATWWGNTLPPTLTTTSGVGAMYIKFTSDASVNEGGWKAGYTSTGITPTCSGGNILTDSSGAFSDGSGSSNYGNNQLCYWFISPPCATTVTLSFSQFDTEQGYDGVIIYDDWDLSNQLAVYTGSGTPNSVTSYTGKMVVIFISDYMVTEQGFSANYSSTGSSFCSGTINVAASDWGVISDGSGTDDYCNNSDCQWLIQPPHATSITLDFISFDLEAPSPDGKTIYDAVKIYDGSTINATLLGTFTGDNLPPSVTSSSGTMLIHFFSDIAESRQGWQAVYTSTQNTYCSGNVKLTAPTGTFSDGSDTAMYSNNSECSWLIQPANVSDITLTFSSFNTEQDYDGVIIYDGVDNTAPLLGQFSGSTIPNAIKSTGGSMYIEFVSDPAERDNGWSASYSSTNCLSTSSTNITACQQYTWMGKNYEVSGTYYDTIHNIAGCDSVMTLNLNIVTPTASTINASACGLYSWMGNNYSTSGTYIDTIPNATGCDSFITLQLVINTIDTSVTVNTPSLTSNAAGASYQWIDCQNGNQPISGEKSRVFTATKNGSYAVIVTESNCTDTSRCFTIANVGMPEINFQAGLLVYPNPTINGAFTIRSEFEQNIEVRLFDILGKEVLKKHVITKGDNIIDVRHISNGNYFLKFEYNGTQKIQKLIVD